MKLLSFACAACLLLSISTIAAQDAAPINKKQEIERLMEKISSFKQFIYIAMELEMTQSELSNYPVIPPVRRERYTRYISSAFGKRRHPIKQTIHNHTGIDIPAPKGTPVYATGNGVVVNLGWNKGYGNYVELKHAAGFSTFYAHLDRILLSIGDSVTIGEHIACVGNTGISTGNHLHYEVRKNGRFLDAEGWCWGMVKIKRLLQEE